MFGTMFVLSRSSGAPRLKLLKPGMMCGVLFGAAITVAADPMVFTYKVGGFEVYMLVENRGQGRSSILIGANDAQLKQYVPGGTYQSETNTFLIRTPDRIILVDTGFGSTLFESMGVLGIKPEQVDTVLLTHLHGDHIGGLQKNGQALFPKAEVYLAHQEREYWTKTNVNQSAVAALAPYGSRVHTFLPGDLGAAGELLPGITPIAAFGHTPGHTLYLVTSAGKKLLIWGDLMHVQGIQFPLPAISVSYDTDPAAAAAIRRRVLEYAAQNSIPVGGMHLNYPAVGTVRAEGDGFGFRPLN
ncbi:MAG: MBL fold metallo-hydrolase [Treponema sp.]|jgi:glyoxylase-like metal-dependent hydrolase (beta-lactamase superfamily II)|nr:MBL fold metallo-hydrolase [Treponema sp.]